MTDIYVNCSNCEMKDSCEPFAGYVDEMSITYEELSENHGTVHFFCTFKCGEKLHFFAKDARL